MLRAEGHWRFGLTEAGRVILRGMCFVVLASLIVPAFGVLSILVAAMLMAFIVGLVFRPRMQVIGRLPDRVIAGQTAHLTYTLKNVGRLPAYHLRLRFRALPETIEQTAEAQMVWRLGPGETAEVAVALRPTRRGCYRLRPPSCESNFPFNLFRFSTSRRGEESVTVLPAFSLLDISLPYLSRHVNASSARPAGRMGTSPEYIGSRPFQPGDSPRRIDVRAWARLSVPATKEYDDDLDNYAALILDTRAEGWRDAKTGSWNVGRFRRWFRRTSDVTRDEPRRRETLDASSGQALEAAVSLCASLAYTIHRDCLIDLLLAGPDLHPLASMPKLLRLDAIHETLATVAPSGDYTGEQIGLSLEDRLSEISEAIFILLRWDRTYQQVVERAEQAGCHCTVIVVGEADQEVGDSRQRTEDRTARTAPFSVLCPLPSGCRFVSATEILAGRSEPL